MQLDQLNEPRDLAKFWGKNFSLIFFDEVGEANGLDLIDKLRASLRPAKAVPGRMILIGNPGGPNHATLLKRYVAGTHPWTPTLDPKSGRHFIWCPSTLADNPHIDREAYVAQLRAACVNDAELLKAWLLGDWSAAKGGYFASVIDEERNLVEPWPGIPEDWDDVWLAVDHGSAAPGVCEIFARSPGAIGPDGRFYPAGRLVIVDEVASNEPDSLTRGLGWTTAQTCDAIKEMVDAWAPANWRYRRVPLEGVGDDSMFASDGRASIASEYRAQGVSLFPARKGSRVAGWVAMKQLLADAGLPDKPGLFVSRRCAYWWQTVPHLGRDPRRPEDVSTVGPDHSADCCRYGILRESRVATMTNWF